MQKHPARSAIVQVVVVVFCSGCSQALQQVSPGVMTWAEYSALQASGRHPEWPYVLRLNSRGGVLLYFGAAHSFDPTNSQFAQIEQEWKTFNPDIAFTEGGLPPLAVNRDEAIRNAGEPGFVRFLAARDNVPTTTLDPSRAQEVAALSGGFSREQIKLFFLLRTVSQYVQRGGTAGLAMEVDRVLGIFGATPGLSGSPRTIDDLRAAYERYFPGAGGYEEVSASWFDPVATGTFLNEISRASSDYRDEYMVRLLVQHAADRQRVFAVVGGSHVVMQEAALRSRFQALQ
jgi:hypothetical protein